MVATAHARRTLKMRVRIAAVNAFVSRVMSAGSAARGRAAPRRRRRAGERQVGGVAHPLPLVREAESTPRSIVRRYSSISSTSSFLAAVGHGLAEHLVDAGEVPQQQPLGALQFVVEHVLGERPEVLEHLARDRLRADVLLADPRVPVGEGVEGVVDEVAERLRVLELLELLHALVVLDAVGLHLARPPGP